MQTLNTYRCVHDGFCDDVTHCHVCCVSDENRAKAQDSTGHPGGLAGSAWATAEKRLTNDLTRARSPGPPDLQPGLHVQLVHRGMVENFEFLLLEVVQEPGGRSSHCQYHGPQERMVRGKKEALHTVRSPTSGATGRGRLGQVGTSQGTQDKAELCTKARDLRQLR